MQSEVRQESYLYGINQESVKSAMTREEATPSPGETQDVEVRELRDVKVRDARVVKLFESDDALAQVAEAPTMGRSTVLPEVASQGEGIRVSVEDKARYEAVSALGEGAAGEVLLARDNDIQRKVALKKLKKKWHTPSNLQRFVDEIRLLGTLEHPNIVPIHDVGLDEEGHFYFVMKYVEGETLAEIIARLRAGDRKTHARFPFAVRNQIFLKILQAVQFAHSQGIVHRDLKPANIMIGPYGEVMVMDWGLAKQLRCADEPDLTFRGFTPLSPQGVQAPDVQGAQAGASGSDFALAETASADALSPAGGEERSVVQALPLGHIRSALPQPRYRRKRPKARLETQPDALLGTPAYMSPEQALARNNDVDERSDIYSLSVLYYEWIGLQHYMAHKRTLQQMLFGIVSEKPQHLAMCKHPAQPAVPVEFAQFVHRGLAKLPRERYQSIEEMIDALQRTISGEFAFHCPHTFHKRMTNEWLRLTDRFPFLTLLVFFLTLTCLALGGLQAAQLLHAWLF